MHSGEVKIVRHYVEIDLFPIRRDTTITGNWGNRCVREHMA